MRRIGTWLILSSITIGLAVPFAYGGVAALNTLREVPAAKFIFLLGMAMLGWACNAGRLHILARNLGTNLTAKTAVSTIIACEFAAVATPLGSGSLPMHILLLSRQGITAGRSMAIMAMDRVMDLIFFATAIPCAIAAYVYYSGHSDLLRWGITAGILLMSGLTLLYALLRHHRLLVRCTGRVIHYIPWLKKKRRRLTRLLLQFHDGIRQLFAMDSISLLLLYALCMSHWLIRYSILPLLLGFTGHSIPWSYLFVVQGLVLFAGQLTMLPGGGGSVEFALGLLLSPYLTPAVTAATLLGWRFITFHWSLLVGAPVFLFIMGRRPVRLILDKAPVD